MIGSRTYKVSFYSPLVLSLAVIGLIWAWLYNPQYGLINQFLTMLGVEDLPGWLGERGLAIWAVIFAAVWRQVGYVMVLYLAGLRAIPVEMKEAARVDGASEFQVLRHISFPLLRPVTLTARTLRAYARDFTCPGLDHYPWLPPPSGQH